MGEAKEKVTVFTGSLKVGCYSSPWQNLIRLITYTRLTGKNKS